MGPYGAYNEPLLPPSEDMRDIVGDMLSMAGGTAAVLLQIAVCEFPQSTHPIFKPCKCYFQSGI